MTTRFIHTKEGDCIDPRFITTVNPNPCDSAVADGAQVVAILTSGFLFHVRAGDLRAALGIELAPVPDVGGAP